MDGMLLLTPRPGRSLSVLLKRGAEKDRGNDTKKAKGEYFEAGSEGDYPLLEGVGVPAAQGRQYICREKGVASLSKEAT